MPEILRSEGFLLWALCGIGGTALLVFWWAIRKYFFTAHDGARLAEKVAEEGATLAARIDEHDHQLITLREQIRNLPSSAELVDVRLSVTTLRGEIAANTAVMEKVQSDVSTVRRQLELLNQHLLTL